jgi:dynactin complex subunit
VKRFASVIVLTTTIGVILPLAGCQNSGDASQITASDSRQTRLLADENVRLKDQIQKQEVQIAKLTKDLQQCGKEETKTREDAGKSVTFIIEQTKAQTAKLDDENTKLKAQVEKLESELAGLKKKSEAPNP